MLAADGPTPREMLRDLARIRRDPLAYLEGVVARFGDLVAFPLPRTPVLLVNDPAGARRVLQDNHPGYGKQTIQYGALSLVTGAGLLTTDGAQWRRRRRTAQPAFAHTSLDTVARESVAAAACLARRWDTLPDGAVTDVDADAMHLTLQVVGRVLLGGEVISAADSGRVVAAVSDALAVVIARARTPVPVPGWVPTPSARRLRAALRTLDETCLGVVRRRRAAGLSPDDQDLLALLLRAADAEGGYTDAEVRDELVTLVIAGHETVASCLAWTLHLLARHPQVQQRLHAELDRVLPDGREPGWTDLAALPLTRAVVEESLRLFPPAWVLTRQALRDDVVCGVAVPKGTLVILSPWLLHRRASSWPDPQRFDPGRFLQPDGAGACASSGPRPGYLPFGAGPRLCIGRDFALVEAVLVLAALLRRHRVAPSPAAGGCGEPPQVEALVTLRPRGGLPLTVHRRAVLPDR